MFVDLNACRRRLAALDIVRARILMDRDALLAICNHVDLAALDAADRRAMANELRGMDMALAECRSERQTVCQLMDLDEGEDSIHPVSQITTVFIG